MLFSYHAILLYQLDADIKSISPSLSISIANTLSAPSAFVVTICCGPNVPLPSIFSYHAILSSVQDADIKSISPSLSISIANTLVA